MPPKTPTDPFTLTAAEETPPATLLTDDITDPAVPPTVFGAEMPQEAIATPPMEQEQAATYNGPTVNPGTPEGYIAIVIDEGVARFAAQIETVIQAVETTLAERLQAVEQQNAALAIAILGEGIRQHRPVVPYSATIAVISPSGYPMGFTVQEATHEAFLTAMGGLMGFLTDNGFQPAPTQSGVAF